VVALLRRSLNVAKLGRPKKVHIDSNQPEVVCYDCGRKYGSFNAGQAPWDKDICGCCGKTQACTEPRDFGYLLLGWQERREEELGENDHEDGSSRTV